VWAWINTPHNMTINNTIRRARCRRWHSKHEQSCEQRRDQKRQQKPANATTIPTMLSNDANNDAETQIKDNEFHGRSPLTIVGFDRVIFSWPRRWSSPFVRDVHLCKIFRYN